MSLTDEIRLKEVKRNAKYRPVIDYLWVRGVGPPEGKVFTDIKDIVVFAAMVGKRFERRESLEKNPDGITLLTFGGAGSGAKDNRVDQHNIIFMLSVLNKKNMECLRDESIEETIREFEEYANGGLSIIEGWLEASAWNPLCILDEMVTLAKQDATLGLDVPVNPF